MSEKWFPYAYANTSIKVFYYIFIWVNVYFSMPRF